MSDTVALAPIAQCMMSAERIGGNGESGTWEPSNDLQKQFIENFYSEVIQLIEDLSEDEIKGFASLDVDELNTFLRDQGFDIELDAIEPRSFGVAAIFKVIVKWKGQGIRVNILADGKRYEAANLTKGYRCVTCNDHPHPIAAIYTKTKDTVYITKAPKDVPKGLDLLQYAKQLQNAEQTPVYFDELIFPVTDYDEQVDISWLLKMQITFSPMLIFVLGQALQQTKFRMDEKGAEVESAVTMVCDEIDDDRSEPQILCIDEPYLLWMVRGEHSLPFFAGYITEEHWIPLE